MLRARMRWNRLILDWGLVALLSTLSENWKKSQSLISKVLLHEYIESPNLLYRSVKMAKVGVEQNDGFSPISTQTPHSLENFVTDPYFFVFHSHT